LKADYIKSILGDAPKLSDIYSYKDGKPLKNKGEMSIRIFNQPNDKIGLFALGTILNYVDALKIEPSLWKESDKSPPNEIVVFDDFFNSDGTFNKENFKKYGVSIASDRSDDPDAPNCFTVRGTSSGIIKVSMNFIDIKLNEEKMRDCVVRDIGFSFGLLLYPLKETARRNEQSFDDFSHDFGPFLAERREKCTSGATEILDYSCLAGN
jgi:hypothetical protein